VWSDALLAELYYDEIKLNKEGLTPHEAKQKAIAEQPNGEHPPYCIIPIYDKERTLVPYAFHEWYQNFREKHFTQ
jgi:hypothetical protein